MKNRYRVLIVDDEPLVQIGLKSIFDRDLNESFEVAASAGNGRDAYEIIINDPDIDIVISDIKMPIMTGLELIDKVRNEIGKKPVFIMLTAYDDFEMVRSAMAGEAVDYLIKIELSADTLREALNRCTKRLSEMPPLPSAAAGSDNTSLSGAPGADTSSGTTASSLEEFRQSFLIKLLCDLIPDRPTFDRLSSENRMDFSYNRYITVYCSLKTDGITDNDRLRSLCLSVRKMTTDILGKYSPCYTIANDIRHFTFIFYFNEDEAIADVMKQINDALENAIEMIDGYFNVSLYFGIGTAVSDPMEIHTSFEESKIAEGKADVPSPIRVFSHIVGTNRRSGKDRLISSIQDYIDENLNGKLQLTEVAEHFGLSPAYLSSIFKKNTEIGFSEYVYTKKIEKAKELLLNDDMKIYEVADALSFESAYYFSKVFKRVEGVSPRDWLAGKLGG
ncbi:MAG: response regulator [Lachnospiraceae bacterium]|nr:response regulator [Lachnospiraceae bacterium]